MENAHDRAEAERLNELASYGVLDTAPEEAFDRLTALAAEMLGRSWVQKIVILANYGS